MVFTSHSGLFPATHDLQPLDFILTPIEYMAFFPAKSGGQGEAIDPFSLLQVQPGLR